MPVLNYHTTTRIWLNTEGFQNAGLTPERIKEIIEGYRGDGDRYYCENSGLNSNWIIETHCKNPKNIQGIVWNIERLLNDELGLTNPASLYYFSP